MMHFSGVPLLVRRLVLPENLRLGWKGPSGSKTLAYFGPLSVIKEDVLKHGHLRPVLYSFLRQ
jgi:hypothetical protein